MRTLFLYLFTLLITAAVSGQTPDTIPPYLSCKPQFSVGLTPTCLVTLWATDMADSVSDASQPVQLGVRRICTGSGFPLKDQLQFSANDLGAQTLELWAKDPAGNLSTCQLVVHIGDGLGFCDPGFSIFINTPLDKGIDSVYMHLSGYNCLADTFFRELYSSTPGCCDAWGTGIYTEFGAIAPAPGYETSLTPYKNDLPLNGLTTSDLTLISKHIMGIEPMNSPYKIIAADANQDGKVTTYDVVLLRRLMLGLIPELPNGKSWRFLPYGYVFPNPKNPFQPAFPEKIQIPASADPLPGDFRFIGIKIGDVDFSAFPGG